MRSRVDDFISFLPGGKCQHDRILRYFLPFLYERKIKRTKYLFEKFYKYISQNMKLSDFTNHYFAVDARVIYIQLTFSRSSFLNQT